MVEAYFDWISFFTILLILVFTYLIIKFVEKFAPYFITNLRKKRKLKRTLRLVIEIFKPISIAILVLSFIAVNFWFHGGLLLVIGLITFTQIKNYIHGVLFKINPIVEKGAFIKTGEFYGEIEEFHFFGIVINVPEGKRFVSYKHIDSNGFFINQLEKGILRKTVYLDSSEDSNKVIDILFENPLLSFSQKPIIKDCFEKEKKQLEFTLEKGVSLEAIIAYLNKNQIKTYSN